MLFEDTLSQKNIQCHERHLSLLVTCQNHQSQHIGPITDSLVITDGHFDHPVQGHIHVWVNMNTLFP